MLIGGAETMHGLCSCVASRHVNYFVLYGPKKARRL